MEEEMSEDIKIHLVRMEGKMDLITEKLNRQDNDLNAVRNRQHELANSVQVVQSEMRGVSQFQVEATRRLEAHSERLDVHDNAASERKGVAVASKWIYAIIGTLATVSIALAGVIINVAT